MEDILEEIEVIKSIYCGQEEFFVERHDADSVVLSVEIHSPKSPFGMTLTLSLSQLYPSYPPLISVKSAGLSRSTCGRAKTRLEEVCESLKGEPMLFQVISSLRQFAEDLWEDGTGGGAKECQTRKEESQDVTCLLQLDHMRDRNHYSKIIHRWVHRLGLVGRLVFCQKLILILLQGHKEAVKNYICQNRSQCVDVDSRGKPCKERLLSVLCDDVIDERKVYSDFASYDVTSLEELKARFKQDGLERLAEDIESWIKA